jgi:hypothetical protein
MTSHTCREGKFDVDCDACLIALAKRSTSTTFPPTPRDARMWVPESYPPTRQPDPVGPPPPSTRNQQRLDAAMKRFAKPEGAA